MQVKSGSRERIITQGNSALDFTANDQMIVAAAKMIRNEDAAYVGVGLSMFATLLARLRRTDMETK